MSTLEKEANKSDLFMTNLKRTKHLLQYGLTFIGWGAVAATELSSYSFGFTLALSLQLGTAILTLIALGPATAKVKKISI